MKTNPKSASEIAMMDLIEPGIYNFQVFEATEKVSKSGNEMIELKLRIWDNNGRERIVFDYLLTAFAHKLRTFCEAVGLLEQYEADNLNANDCLSKSGKVDLGIQAEKKKDDGSSWPAKNTVLEYVVSDAKTAAQPAVSEPKTTDFIDDDLPF